MKKIFNYIIFSLLLSFIFVSTMFLAGGWRDSLSFSSASSFNAEENVDDTLFMINVDLVQVGEHSIFIYDENDHMIKVIDKQTLNFKTTNNHLKISGVTDLIYFNEHLLVFINNGQDFKCFDAHTLEELEVEHSFLTLQTSKYREIAKIGSSYYMILCPENVFSEKFELAKIELSSSLITFSSPSTFSISNGFANSISDYSGIYACENDGSLVLMLISDEIFALNIDPAVQYVDSEITNLIQVTGVTNVNEIVNISEVSIGNPKESYLCITSLLKTQLYKLSIGLSGISLEAVEQTRIEIDELFILSSADAYSSTLALVSNLGQKVQYINFDKNEDQISYTTEERKNPEVASTIFGPDSFEYHYAIRETALKESPYSKDALVMIGQNHHLVVIGKGQSNNEDVHGWYYCLYSNGQENYYGYVSGVDIYFLNETTYDHNYITVLTHTNLYRLPSKISDETNTVLRVIPDNSRLEVLSTLNDYSSLNTKYLLVKVNNQTVGFIDRDRVVGVDENTELVLTNAKVMRNNSEIFASTDENRETIMTLNKGARVKVIGKRDTISNFTQICFNDEEGNEIEGYIYTYNLEYDAWSTLQIIGVVLIVINVLLLVVIIIIKNKVTR